MNDTKKVGRPKKFNEETALQAAVNVFWSKGYNGASMKDLTTAMQINSPSLYATYGDKETLFLKTVEYYMAGHNCTPLDAFEQEPDVRIAVRKFFKEIITYATKDENKGRGCFLSSCVATCAETVEGAKPLLQQAIHESENRIARRFNKEKKDGKLPQDFPSKCRARLMFDLRQGLVFKARSGISQKSIQADLKYWVHIVLDP